MVLEWHHLADSLCGIEEGTVATSRFVLSGRQKAARLAYVPALVELRLPQGFHDMPPVDQRRAVEVAMADALEQAGRVIDFAQKPAA